MNNMKRIITFFGAITLFGSSLMAQSFAFFQHGNQLENNAVITITEYDTQNMEEYGWLDMEADVELKNLTENTLFSCFAQTVLEGPIGEGKLAVCCLGNCYPPSNDDEVHEGNAEPGDHFGFHLSFGGQVEEGEDERVKVQYDIYPKANPNDKTTVIIIYEYSATGGIKELSRNDNVLVFSQNGKITFKFNQISPDMQLVIYNITGREIGQYYVNSEKFILPETLSNGIYIYTLKEKGKVSYTGKYVQK